nr:hypothetical protein [uncultured Roseateles sp.]
MMHRTEYTVTRKGIIIGGAYTRPAPTPGQGMEAVQSALLGTPKPAPWWVRLIKGAKR